jgi:hypothetical protein
MTDLSPAAWAVLCAYRDFSWTPDEEDNSRYYKFSHKAGMAAALRTAALIPNIDRLRLLAIADELEGNA